MSFPSIVDSSEGASCLLNGLLTFNSNVFGLEHSMRGTTSTILFVHILKSIVAVGGCYAERNTIKNSKEQPMTKAVINSQWRSRVWSNKSNVVSDPAIYSVN